MANYNNTEDLENVYKVKLQSTRRETVSFDATPDLIETRNVNYSTIEPIHAPGQINVFKNTSSRSFNISNARLITRTQTEAEKNLRRLWLLRSWCMPRFGTSTLSEQNTQLRDQQFEFGNGEGGIFGSELLGSPPSVLFLSAYSRGSGTNKMQHLHRIPVAIQQLSIPYPSDVDYIPTLSGIPMPTIMTIDLTLVETHSPNEYENFSLDNFKKGQLENF